MNPNEVFDDIMQNIDPDEIPLEYIVFAKITDVSGRARIIKGPETLKKVLRGPARNQIAEAQVVLDERKIRLDIIQGVDEIYEAVTQMIAENEASDDDKDTDI